MTVRIRRSVHSLPAGDDTLDWYRRAVGALLERDTADPRSWLYMGAVHGNPFGQVPPGAAPFWDQCQHQTWFFLPWHRGYITAFEAVIAATVADLGGPADWALPYWNYSEDLVDQPRARLMPDAFLAPRMPDGSPNRLFSRRRAVAGGDFNLDPGVVDLGALDEPAFTSSAPGATAGFGGPRSGFNHFGGPNGALESVPHNIVHTRIGGPTGFMSDPATAALDPIFWLHHCNIDRLWEVWRRRPGNATPNDPQWLSAVRFDMHDGDGQPFSFTPADMLDTEQVLHGYVYDTLPPVPAQIPTEGVEMAEAEDTPELAGASDGATRLSGDVTRARVSMQTRMSRKSFTESALTTPRRVLLNLENVTGHGVPDDYAVFVDLDDDDLPPLRVGMLTTFGIERATDPDRDHGGAGLTQVFDITRAADRLNLTEGSADDLRVTFVRAGGAAISEGVPAGMEELVRDEPHESGVEVGRISVYFQ